jgi:hypothetical protein
LYSSIDVLAAIQKVLADGTDISERVCIVAYLGKDARKYIPDPNGVRIICNPEPGATSPDAVRYFLEHGSSVEFCDSLHSKIYWSKAGCVVTSANLSHRALGSNDQIESGVLLSAGEFDIERMLNLIPSDPVTKSSLTKLDRETRAIFRKLGIRKKPKNIKSLKKWAKSEIPEQWKLSWASCPVEEACDAAKSKSKSSFNISEPHDFVNLSKGQAKPDEWQLVIDTENPKKLNCSWLYTDFLVFDGSEKDYPYQAVQVFTKSRYPQPPFKLDKQTKKLVLEVCESYGLDKIEKMKSLVPPKNFLSILLDKAKKSG